MSKCVDICWRYELWFAVAVGCVVRVDAGLLCGVCVGLLLAICGIAGGSMLD